MAIRPSAGAANFVLKNSYGRDGVSPPIIFPGSTPTSYYAWSLWVQVHESGIPTTVIGHTGVDGSLIHFGHDGFNWILFTRKAGVINFSQALAPITLNKWTLWCFVQNGPDIIIYMGVSDGTATPVSVEQVLDTPLDLDFVLDNFTIWTSSNNSICNFKFWDNILTQSQIQAQANTFSTQSAGQGIAPFWVSPLRIKGDLSNVQNPEVNYEYDWGYGHAFDTIVNKDNLIFIPDPVSLVGTECSAWVQPTAGLNTDFHNFLPTDVWVDPGLSPAIPTMYKAPQFFDFLDQGAVPLVDSAIVSILYCGAPKQGEFPVPPFIFADEYWGLFKDENGAEVSNTIDPKYRFEPVGPSGNITVIQIPGNIKATTMYKWKFGGQFLFNPITPQRNTVSAHLITLKLYVTYSGTLGAPPTSEDLSGLFAISSSNTADKYYGNKELKIPDPTIRTALIGE